MIAALQYGPVAATVDASSFDWIFYTGGIITDAAACGTNTNSAVLVTGYNNGEPDGTPYFEVKWSGGIDWGIGGYARIGIENGIGICAIQAEAAIPNLLLTSDSFQVIVIFILLGFTLFVLVPLSFYFWKSHEEKLAFMHPGQMILRKVMYYEAVYMAVGLILFIIAETNNINCWDIESATVYFLLLCNHVD
jgi:hypothetical protein